MLDLTDKVVQRKRNDTWDRELGRILFYRIERESECKGWGRDGGKDHQRDGIRLSARNSL